ncbi:hypothetical protein CYMTET_30955 [Cymbomonas tetramitiformis]|uniref:Zinc finger Sec23/Sec24-type domain-containing protein n=1 Tax=Cymbomonas tetramitiformis TaxID=36881 RepID=A0AAE0KTF4_9CHLO|nr:hypothetical protein CYMTET_30955 [Cymbomonas tetramitiformis]
MHPPPPPPQYPPSSGVQSSMSGGTSGYPGTHAQSQFMAPPTQPATAGQVQSGGLTQPPPPPLAAPQSQGSQQRQPSHGGYIHPGQQPPLQTQASQHPSSQQTLMQQPPTQSFHQQSAMQGPPLQQPSAQQSAVQPRQYPVAQPRPTSVAPPPQRAVQRQEVPPSSKRIYPPTNAGHQTSSAAGETRPAAPKPSSTSSQSSSGYSSRIDPSQIPRPPPQAFGGSAPIFETRPVSGNSVNPPPATSAFVVRDTGNCSPRFIRPTLNQIPATSELLQSSGMPLALMVQPMALLEPGEEPLQVVDFGEAGPVRCGRCKAYINPYMKFMENGRRFQCNLCGFLNDCPRDYMCHLGPDGRRQMQGSVFGRTRRKMRHGWPCT